MVSTPDPLKTLWDNLLSRQPERVRAVFNSLNAEDRRAVLSHLERMASEPAWHSEQRASAIAALRALSEETGA